MYIHMYAIIHIYAYTSTYAYILAENMYIDYIVELYSLRNIRITHTYIYRENSKKLHPSPKKNDNNNTAFAF